MLTEFQIWGSRSPERTDPELIGTTLSYGEAVNLQQQAVRNGYAIAWVEEVPVDPPHDAGA